MADFDVCVIGSGAGGGPVAFALANAGRRVVVLEKGAWFKDGDFSKDEIGEVRRSRFTPRDQDEPRVLEWSKGDGTYAATPTVDVGVELWNGVMVGGATNLMSGFFLRLKPEDFRLRSEFGAVDGADVVDWPVDYDAMERWYDRVEKEVGISGRVIEHPRQEPRSSKDFPQPPTDEHVLARRIDEVGRARGLHPVPLPRAILSRDRDGRGRCSYTGFCGSYGCTTGAKGSARTALLDRAVATGRCEVRTGRTARFLETDTTGRVVAVHHHGADGKVERLDASLVVVACQPIETARLLLLSRGARHPAGIGNANDLVGRFLLTSPGGVGWGDFPYRKFASLGPALRERGPFVNRTFQDWQDYVDPVTSKRRKGGNVDFLISHPNAIQSAMLQSSVGVDGSKRPMFGRALQEKVRTWMRDAQHLKFETFSDWMPVPTGRVTLDPAVVDRFGQPVARVRFEDHPYNHQTAEFLAERGREILQAMGAENVNVVADGSASTNLVAGGARFGRDPKTSVLDPSCRVHTCDNLYVTDGSFMPTGGSVPYTWTIYANSFRVAEKLIERLGGPKK